VYQQTTETSGRDTERLQDEQITECPSSFNLWANGLRAMELPKGITSGEKNALLRLTI
jgi:hypothetical protein